MSSLNLISHRMLVSALPHELPQESPQPEPTPGASAVAVPLQVLDGRELSDIMARDEAVFQAPANEPAPN